MTNKAAEVVVNITTKISLWDAIKLRIAGADIVHKIIEKEFKRKLEKQ